MLTVAELAQMLITPYEELRVWIDSPFEISEDFKYAVHTMTEDISPGGLLAPYADRTVATVDSYYSGDHMVLELKLES